MALISIAHPKFRPWLLECAKEMKYVYQDQELPPPGAVYPEEYETFFTTRSGVKLFIRPLKIDDEEKLRDMFYELSDESRYLRFFTPLRTLPHSKAQPQVLLDYQERMAIGAFLGDPPGEKLVGVARYILDRRTNFAEVAVEVADPWQNQGIGTFLLNYLIRIARRQGIVGFTASVLADNRKMLKILENSGYQLKTKFQEGAYEIEFRFDELSNTRRGEK